MSILEEIVANKRTEIAGLKTSCPRRALEMAAAERAPAPGFAAALRSAPIGLIAEVKRRSPSAGAIREPFDPPAIARSYASGGAQALSVLIDGKYFGGGEADFRAVRLAVALPMLYKEFVVDDWQIWHAASLGASAVLLIAAALDDRALASLMTSCAAARVEPLLEVHNEAEMKRAAASGAKLVGVNNRDLATFTVSLDTSIRLKALAPESCTLVSESGVRSADDVVRLRRAGFHAVLVGERLLRQNDLDAAVRALMTPAWMK